MNKKFNITAAPFQNCEAILFDFGGTLDSDGEHWLDRFYALYQNARLNVSLSEIKRAFYHADRMCCEDPQLLSADLRSLMKHHVRIQFEDLSIRDGAKEKAMIEEFCVRSERFLKRNGRLLRAIRKHFRLGLVSNFYGNVSVLCREAGIADVLEVILDSVVVGIGKPDPAIFRLALAELDLPPDRVIFVGDSYERDMIPARRLGMKTIWLKGPNPRIPENAEPVDAWISGLSELYGRIT